MVRSVLNDGSSKPLDTNRLQDGLVFYRCIFWIRNVVTRHGNNLQITWTHEVCSTVIAFIPHDLHRIRIQINRGSICNISVRGVEFQFHFSQRGAARTLRVEMLKLTPNQEDVLMRLKISSARLIEPQ